MGNQANKPKNDDEIEGLIDDFLSGPSQRFQAISDNHFGEIHLPNPENGSVFFLKQLVFQDSSSFSQALEKLQRKTLLSHENLLKILKVKSLKQSQYCSNVYKIAFLFEYAKRDLSSEIRCKRLRNERFSDLELRKFIKDAVSALSFLQKRGVFLGGLRNTSIFLDSEGKYRFLDPEIFKLRVNFAHFTQKTEGVRENYSSAFSSGVYLSPEQLDLLRKGDFRGEINGFKSDVFALGVIILEMVNLKALDSLYEYQSFKIKEKAVQEFIQANLQGKYREEIVQFVEKCLCFHPEQRPDFIGLDRFFTESSSSKGGKKVTLNREKNSREEEKLTNKENILGFTPLNLQRTNQEKTLSNFVHGSSETPEIIKHLHSNFNFTRGEKQEPEQKPGFSHTVNPVNKPIIYDAIIDKPLAENPFISSEKPPVNQENAKFNAAKLPDNNPFNNINNINNINNNNNNNNPYTCLINELSPFENARKPLENRIEEPRKTSSLLENVIKPCEIPVVFSFTKKPENVGKSLETYEDGSFYSGDFLQGLRHGKGFFQYSDGGTYEGSWKQGQMDGFGVLYYPNHEKAYEGFWVKDKFHGKGCIYNEDCSFDSAVCVNFKDFGTIGQNWTKYEGYFENDCKHGNGVIFFKDNSRFEGDFDRDRVDGKGTYYDQKGGVFKGEWLNNRLIRLY